MCVCVCARVCVHVCAYLTVCVRMACACMAFESMVRPSSKTNVPAMLDLPLVRSRAAAACLLASGKQSHISAANPLG